MQATIGRATASLASGLFPLRSSRCHALRNGCSPASSCRLQRVKQASRQSFRATHALAIPVCCIVENIRHTRHVRAQQQKSARTLRSLHWRRSCLRTSLIRALYRRAVTGCFGGCHAFMPGETQKPRQPPGSGCHAACKKTKGQASRQPFAICSTQRYTAAVMPLATREKQASRRRRWKSLALRFRVRFAFRHGAPRTGHSSPWGTAKTKLVCLFPQGPFASALRLCSSLFPLAAKVCPASGGRCPPGNGFQT